MPAFFSGYLDLINYKVFYLYVQSENSSNIDPTIIWFDGEPGCSGLIKAYTGIGPWFLDSSVNISHNPYSWSKFANLVFIDSFVGTGFSFSQNVYDTDYTDEFASYSSFEIIKALFMAHPNLNETSFYFASQNYGGHLLPQITLRLFNDVVSNPNLFVNFSGLILGNPMVSFSTSVGSQIETLWGQQLIPLSVWNTYNRQNCSDNSSMNMRGFSNTCRTMIADTIYSVSCFFPNKDFLSNCDLISESSSTYEYLKRKSHSSIQSDSTYISPYVVTYLNDLMNTRQQQVLLGAINKSDASRTWLACNPDIPRNWLITDVFSDGIKLLNEVVNHRNKPKNFRVLILSGDSDIYISTLGTQNWIYTLKGAVVNPEYSWKQWFDGDNQPAGYLTKFENNITFLTVHGANRDLSRVQTKRTYDAIYMLLYSGVNTSSIVPSNGYDGWQLVVLVFVILLSGMILVVTVLRFLGTRLINYENSIRQEQGQGSVIYSRLHYEL